MNWIMFLVTLNASYPLEVFETLKDCNEVTRSYNLSTMAEEVIFICEAI